MLKEYEKIAGADIIRQIRKKAKKFRKKHIVSISSTPHGGGVAEMLNSLVMIFNELGINFGWRIIHGNPDFFTITKKIHNGLQGSKIKISPREKELYLETNRRFSQFTHLDHDLVIVHDPQPLGLISFYKKRRPWIFRAHIDLSSPYPTAWDFVKPFIEKYDRAIISMEQYKQDLKIPQTVIHPAIDPLSDKNRALSSRNCRNILEKIGLDLKRPIISQISRFDKWKDPEGVVRIFEEVKKKFDCRLVLAGNLASDDPEAIGIYNSLIKKYSRKKDIKILLNIDDLAVNALQRSSSVIIQKSLREGFGLTVSEALYKGVPVAASYAGGIPIQAVNGNNAFLHDPSDIKGFAQSILVLLNDEKKRRQFGQRGRKHIINNFLITRLVMDWLDLFDEYLS